eukprot:scpid98895/ scgid26831/ 
MKKDLHFNYKCELAELKVAISSLSQRVVFESFMEDLVPFLQELETVTPKEKAALSELHPKMNVLNRVLRRCWPNAGKRLLPTFVINGQFVTDFPNLGRRGMMYGNLSDRVHTPTLRHVFVVKSESESVRLLFRLLSERYNYVYEEIDEGQAAAAALDEDEAYYNRTPSQLCWALSSN